jgi:hypothetical protein
MAFRASFGMCLSISSTRSHLWRIGVESRKALFLFMVARKGQVTDQRGKKNKNDFMSA